MNDWQDSIECYIDEGKFLIELPLSAQHISMSLYQNLPISYCFLGRVPRRALPSQPISWRPCGDGIYYPLDDPSSLELLVLLVFVDNHFLELLSEFLGIVVHSKR